MVRAAVRTLTLSVYRVREPSLEKFLLERISKPYFTQLIYDCQQIAIKIDTQHETGQVAQELLNEERDFFNVCSFCVWFETYSNRTTKQSQWQLIYRNT